MKSITKAMGMFYCLGFTKVSRTIFLNNKLFRMLKVNGLKKILLRQFRLSTKQN